MRSASTATSRICACRTPSGCGLRTSKHSSDEVGGKSRLRRPGRGGRNPLRGIRVTGPCATPRPGQVPREHTRARPSRETGSGRWMDHPKGTALWPPERLEFWRRRVAIPRSLEACQRKSGGSGVAKSRRREPWQRSSCWAQRGTPSAAAPLAVRPKDRSRSLLRAKVGGWRRARSSDLSASRNSS
jgi:hypothetical protein